MDLTVFILQHSCQWQPRFKSDHKHPTSSVLEDLELGPGLSTCVDLANGQNSKDYSYFTASELSTGLLFPLDCGKYIKTVGIARAEQQQQQQ